MTAEPQILGAEQHRIASLSRANFQAIESHQLRWLIRNYWWMQIPLLGLDALVFASSGTPGLKLLLILSPHVFVAAAIILSYRVFERLPQTLRRLWDRGVIEPRRERPEPLTCSGRKLYRGVRSAPRRRKTVPVDRGGPAQFDAFVRTLQRRMNRKVPAVVLGGGFAFLFYLFYPASDHPWGFPVTSHFHGAWRSWILTPDLVIQTALVLVLGFVGWRLMVIAWEVWHLAGDFDFRFDLRHPDKSAGLAPLGDLCFSLAAVWAVVAIYPTTWVAILHFAPLAKTGWFSLGHLFHTTNHILDEVRQHQAKLKDIRPAILIAIRGPLFWLSWYVLGLLGVTLAFAVGTFALPLYFVHRGMVRQHPEQVASLDGLGLKIHRLAARIREQASAVETEAATGEGGDGKATPDAAGAAGGGSTGGKAQAVSAEHLDRLKDLNARLKAVEDVYTKSKLIPSWPFDAKVFGKFVGATVVPLTGLTTLVPKILDKFITGGT